MQSELKSYKIVITFYVMCKEISYSIKRYIQEKFSIKINSFSLKYWDLFVIAQTAFGIVDSIVLEQVFSQLLKECSFSFNVGALVVFGFVLKKGSTCCCFPFKDVDARKRDKKNQKVTQIWPRFNNG